MTRWYFQPILESYGLVALLALALVALLFFLPTFQGVRPRQIRILLALRIGIILLAVIAMLRPALVRTTSKPEAASLLVLFDESRSTQIEDAAGGKSRWQAQLDTLKKASPELAKLTKDVELKFYAYAGKPREIKFEKDQIRFPKSPDGSETDIGSSLDETIRAEAGNRLAGVILLGDGAQRALAPSASVQQAARQLARRGTPLYTIPFGQAQDQSQSRDVAVDNFQDQYTVFVKNRLMLRAAVRVQGYVNQEIDVRIEVEHPDGQKSQLGPVPAVASEDGQQVDVRFSFEPIDAGQYKLELIAEEQPGELVLENNRLTAFVTAIDGGLRVLHLFGNSLDPEQQLIRRSLGSSPDIQLDRVFIDPRRQKEWPIQLNTLAETKYDVIVISNVSARALGSDNLAEFAKRVDNGAGLIMTGGHQSFGPGGYANTPLENVVPVEMNKLQLQNLRPDATLPTDLHVNQVQLIPIENHFLVTLADPASQNVATWNELKPMAGANRLTPIANSVVMLEGKPTRQQNEDDNSPVLVAGSYGGGRVIAFAADSTHLWYRQGKQAEHKLFWRQVILWLAKRDDSRQSDVWIRLDRRRYLPTSEVSFQAGVRDTTGEPIDDAELTAEVTTPDGSKSVAQLSKGTDGWQGTFDGTTQPGDYELVVYATRNGIELAKSEAKFIVFAQDVELGDPAASPRQLEALSKITSEAGGRSLPAEELPALIAQIRKQPPRMEVEIQSRWRLGDTPLDAWVFLSAVVALLGTEWFLRKKWGMV